MGRFCGVCAGFLARGGQPHGKGRYSSLAKEHSGVSAGLEWQLSCIGNLDDSEPQILKELDNTRSKFSCFLFVIMHGPSYSRYFLKGTPIKCINFWC